MTLLIPTPLSFLALLGCFSLGPGTLFVALPLWLATGWLIYRSLRIQAHFARVVGRYRTITIRFDRPTWRRALFHRELLRRAGLPDGPMP